MLVYVVTRNFAVTLPLCFLEGTHRRNFINKNGKVGGGQKSTIGIRNCNLRRIQVRKIRKLCLSTGFLTFFLPVHHPNNRAENISIFIFSLFQFTDQRKSSGVKEMLEEHLSSLHRHSKLGL